MIDEFAKVYPFWRSEAIEDLRKFYKENGFLSEKQLNYLLQIYRKCGIQKFEVQFYKENKLPWD